VQVQSLPPLPTPHVVVQEGQHVLGVDTELEKFLSSFAILPQERMEIKTIINHARSAARQTWSFWVDTELQSGNLKLLLVRKVQDHLHLSMGTASIPIPRVTEKRTQCKKRRIVGVTVRRKCWEEDHPRALTAAEWESIGAHLAGALNNLLLADN
jgi:hypothetical protein